MTGSLISLKAVARLSQTRRCFTAHDHQKSRLILILKGQAAEYSKGKIITQNYAIECEEKMRFGELFNLNTSL